MINTKEHIKPVQIDFDQNAYQRAVTDYGKRVLIEKKIREEFKELLGVKFQTKDFKDILKAFWRELKNQNAELLGLGVVLEKIPEIKGIDITDLKSYTQQYQGVKEYNSPNGDSFKTFAVTGQEINKYNACIKVIEALKELEKYCKVYPQNFINGTSFALMLDTRKGVSTEALKPNSNWIQGKRFM